MSRTSLAASALLILVALGASALASEALARPAVEQDAATQEAPASALAPPSEPGPPHRTGPWEYEVVGLTDIYASTFDYLKGALEPGEDGKQPGLGGVLGFGKKVDDQLVAKTRDLLNEYGAQGWELVEYRENILVFKRPKL